MSKTEAVEAAIDYRGSADLPYGFVVFEDTRAGFSDGMLWNANWGRVTGKEFAAAWSALNKAGVKGYEDADRVRLRDAEHGAVTIGIERMALIKYPYED